MKTELLEQINKECKTLGGYDIFTLKEIVSRYCYKHRIKKDSPNWLYLIDELWCELDGIRAGYESIIDFDSDIGDCL